jgi:hypothetical protein
MSRNNDQQAPARGGQQRAATGAAHGAASPSPAASPRPTPRPLATVPLAASVGSPIWSRSPRRHGAEAPGGRRHVGGGESAPGSRTASPRVSVSGALWSGGSAAAAAEKLEARQQQQQQQQQQPRYPSALHTAPAALRKSTSAVSLLRASLGGASSCASDRAGALGGSEDGGGGGSGADARGGQGQPVVVALHVRPMSAPEEAAGCGEMLAVAPGGNEVRRRRGAGSAPRRAPRRVAGACRGSRRGSPPGRAQV